MTSEERKAWLAGLESGDQVAVPLAYARDAYSVYRIDRVTPTLFVIGKTRYRRKDGRLIEQTSPYLFTQIVPVTAHVKERIERSKFAAAFYRYNALAETLPITTVRKLLSLLTEAEREAGKEDQ